MKILANSCVLHIQNTTILIDLLKVTFHLPQLINPETLPFRMR